MTLSIKDSEAERLAREIAEATGQTLTRVVIEALREHPVKLLKNKRKASTDIRSAR